MEFYFISRKFQVTLLHGINHYHCLFQCCQFLTQVVLLKASNLSTIVTPRRSFFLNKLLIYFNKKELFLHLLTRIGASSQLNSILFTSTILALSSRKLIMLLSLSSTLFQNYFSTSSILFFFHTIIVNDAQIAQDYANDHNIGQDSWRQFKLLHKEPPSII